MSLWFLYLNLNPKALHWCNSKFLLQIRPCLLLLKTLCNTWTCKGYARISRPCRKSWLWATHTLTNWLRDLPLVKWHPMWLKAMSRIRFKGPKKRFPLQTATKRARHALTWISAASQMASPSLTLIDLVKSPSTASRCLWATRLPIKQLQSGRLGSSRTRRQRRRVKARKGRSFRPKNKHGIKQERRRARATMSKRQACTSINRKTFSSFSAWNCMGSSGAASASSCSSRWSSATNGICSLSAARRTTPTSSPGHQKRTKFLPSRWPCTGQKTGRRWARHCQIVSTSNVASAGSTFWALRSQRKSGRARRTRISCVFTTSMDHAGLRLPSLCPAAMITRLRTAGIQTWRKERAKRTGSRAFLSGREPKETSRRMTIAKKWCLTLKWRPNRPSRQVMMTLIRVLSRRLWLSKMTKMSLTGVLWLVNPP